MTFKTILTAAIPAVAALCIAASAEAGSVSRPPPIQLPNSPISPSTLVALGLRAGTIPMPPSWKQPGRAHPGLKCTPAPCALPNVEGSAGATQSVNETPIAVNPLNRKQLITGGNDYDCSDSLRAFWTSSNGGKTWSGACGIDVTGQLGDGDPVVAYDLNGNVYQGGIDDEGVSIASSSDNGKTWNAAVISNTAPHQFADKPWLEIDTNAGSPHKNTLYVSNTMSDTHNNSSIWVSRSTDAGKTWSIVQVSPTATYPGAVDQFSDLAIGADGTVYLTYMTCPATSGACTGQQATMYVQKSTDGGSTWSPQVVVDTPTLVPGSCGFYGCLPNTFERVSDIPVIGIDNSGGPSNGLLYVVDYTWAGSYMKVQVTSSTDGGTSWSKPVGVAPESDIHDQFFPWLNVDDHGNVGVTWLDRRNDPDNLEYEAFATWSKDGSSFRTNVQIADTPSNPEDDGFGGTFMGDYSGNAWYGNTLFASWTDTRNGSYSQNEVGGLKR